MWQVGMLVSTLGENLINSFCQNWLQAKGEKEFLLCLSSGETVQGLAESKNEHMTCEEEFSLTC